MGLARASISLFFITVADELFYQSCIASPGQSISPIWSNIKRRIEGLKHLLNKCEHELEEANTDRRTSVMIIEELQKELAQAKAKINSPNPQ